MGSLSYDFLSNSVLFSKANIDNQYKNITVERLEKEIQNYREYTINNYSNLVQEIKRTNSNLKVFSPTRNASTQLLKQTAFYIDQHIINDPLFNLTHEKSEQSKVMGQYLGFEDDGINRQQLTKATKFLKEITPMVAANYVKIFPLSYHFEAPKEIPLFIPDNFYNDILPAELLDFFRENAVVKSMEKIANGYQVVENNLYPCRTIIVDFKGDGFSQGFFYQLMAVQFEDVDESARSVKFRQWLPTTPPDASEFDTWVLQSTNRSAKAYFDKVYSEICISSNLGSLYLCDNNFSNDLISKSFETKDTIQSYTANRIINVELPFLDNIDTEKLMTIREFDADTFTAFRLELEKQFRELRIITDEKQIKLKVENIFHELNEVQGQKIRQKVSQLQRQMGINTLIALGGLMGSIQTAGLSLLATATAVGKGYKDYKDYKDKVKENPAYLLWASKKT